MAQWLPFLEDSAVDAALKDFSQHHHSLALDTTELAEQAQAVAVPDDVMREQLASSLGLSVEEAGLDRLLQSRDTGSKTFEDYLWQEQSALVEALVRAYARRRLRPLLEEFEVLEVEREGEWLLSERGFDEGQTIELLYDEKVVHRERAPSSTRYQLWFMSRPDALLRSRQDNALYLLSFKTASTWDVRKERDAQHDMQGLSEGIEVERRLGKHWQTLHDNPQTWCIFRMQHYLKELPAPPRILGIRYEYLLKGYRKEDKDLSQRVGFTAWTQRSHLLRQYVATSVPQSKKGPPPFKHGDVCWSWSYLDEDGQEHKLAWQNWRSVPVWEGK